MLPSTRPYVTKNVLRLEILPYLADIIVPVLRTSNITLFGKCEKEQLHDILNVMIDYSLTYLQERTVEGTYVFNIDPNIEEIVVFQSLKKQRRVLQYSVKQLIAREIELENMRRLDFSMKRNTVDAKDIEKGKKEDVKNLKKEDKENKDQSAVKDLPNHLQRLKAKNINIHPKDVVSFYFLIIILVFFYSEYTPSDHLNLSSSVLWS